MTLAQVKELLRQAADEPRSDMGFYEMLPPVLAAYLKAPEEISEHMTWLEAALKDRERVIADLNAGLIEYANQSGQGQLMLDNLRLCIDQIRMRK
jgi:uncharacterized circularly permuted ATP-grasp superfamily protein